MTMAHQVKAPLVIAKNHEGGDIYVYEGGIVPDGQPDEWVENHLRDGMIEEVELSDDGEVTGKSSRSRRRSAAGDDE
jgi:hypothetical protein